VPASASPVASRPSRIPWRDAAATRSAAALLLIALLASCAGGPGVRGPAAPGHTRTSTSTGSPSTATTLALLAALPVKGRAPRSGYDRDALFGPSWADVDRNGCDQRNDVLRRDLDAVAFRPGTRDCVVVSGSLRDPYTGRTLPFLKAEAMAVQIDHVVALSNAWRTGAQAWTGSERLTFANDLLNLLAVDGPTNSAKGDGDAATWLPPNKAFRCAYVARQVAVKARYGLWMTAAEKEASARTLSSCPGEPAPAAPPAPPAPPDRSVAPPPGRPAVPPPSAGTAVDPRFRSCREALAAGYGPYTVGRDPEAPWYQDGDGDGVVCEPAA
jgi:hypothetical protein